MIGHETQFEVPAKGVLMPKLAKKGNQPKVNDNHVIIAEMLPA